MPMDRSKYPANWNEISRAIRERAGNRCEWPGCGVRNHAVGSRDRFGVWHDEDDIHALNSAVGESLFGDFPAMIRIVLTVAHMDHDTTNNDPSNLKALCQKHHLNHDREHHMRNAAETRRRKKIQHQPELFEGVTR